jgi:hypothetical protein
MRKKRRARTGATTYVTDEQLIANLQDHAPEILESRVSLAEFDDAIKGLLKESPTAEIQHFFCRPCGEYHPKTHPHHAEMKARQTQKRARG